MQGRLPAALNSACIIIIVIACNKQEKVQLALCCVVVRTLTSVTTALAVMTTARVFQMSGKSSVM